MSEPGPDYTGAIAAAMTAAQDAAAPLHPEYRVTSEGDSTPTSGASLEQVLGAADAIDEAAGAPPDAAVEVAADPVDVSAMGGAVNQWWIRPEDAIAEQAMADSINAQTGGAAVPGSDGVDTGYHPFPPGPAGMSPQ